MDAAGARLIAARIRAGVRPGTSIQLIGRATLDAEIAAGSTGVVEDIAADGSLIVQFDSGFRAHLDPDVVAFRAI